MYPPIVKECLDILHSEALFLILSNITGLTLHKLAVEDDDEDDSDTDPEENNEEPSSKRQKKDDSGTSSGCEQKHDGIKGCYIIKYYLIISTLLALFTFFDYFRYPLLSTAIIHSKINSVLLVNYLEKEVDAKCFSEIRLWKHGSYTLIHDDCNEGSEFALDAILFLNCKGLYIENYFL